MSSGRDSCLTCPVWTERSPFFCQKNNNKKNPYNFNRASHCSVLGPWLTSAPCFLYLPSQCTSCSIPQHILQECGPKGTSLASSINNPGNKQTMHNSKQCSLLLCAKPSGHCWFSAAYRLKCKCKLYYVVTEYSYSLLDNENDNDNEVWGDAGRNKTGGWVCRWEASEGPLFKYNWILKWSSTLSRPLIWEEVTQWWDSIHCCLQTEVGWGTAGVSQRSALIQGQIQVLLLHCQWPGLRCQGVAMETETQSVQALTGGQRRPTWRSHLPRTGGCSSSPTSCRSPSKSNRTSGRNVSPARTTARCCRTSWTEPSSGASWWVWPAAGRSRPPPGSPPRRPEPRRCTSWSGETARSPRRPWGRSWPAGTCPPTRWSTSPP